MSAARPGASTSPVRAAQVAMVWALCGLGGGLLVRPVPLGVAVGLGVFLGWRLGVVRRTVLRAHHRGMDAVRAGQPAVAAQAFAESASLFEARPWLDAGRGLLLGSAARWSYAHAGRTNEAACRALCGETDAARRLVARVLSADPSVAPARALLDQLGAEAPLSADWSRLFDEAPGD